MITYIIETINNEYYCGKTNDIVRRTIEHLKESEPHWFSYNNRKDFKVIIKLNGDFEKEIKRFGVKRFAKAIKELEVSLS